MLPMGVPEILFQQPARDQRGSPAQRALFVLVDATDETGPTFSSYIASVTRLITPPPRASDPTVTDLPSFPLCHSGRGSFSRSARMNPAQGPRALDCRCMQQRSLRPCYRGGK